jgi:predicted transposase YdaD
MRGREKKEGEERNRREEEGRKRGRRKGHETYSFGFLQYKHRQRSIMMKINVNIIMINNITRISSGIQYT